MSTSQSSQPPPLATPPPAVIPPSPAHASPPPYLAPPMDSHTSAAHPPPSHVPPHVPPHTTPHAPPPRYPSHTHLPPGAPHGHHAASVVSQYAHPSGGGQPAHHSHAHALGAPPQTHGHAHAHVHAHAHAMPLPHAHGLHAHSHTQAHNGDMARADVHAHAHGHAHHMAAHMPALGAHVHALGGPYYEAPASKIQRLESELEAAHHEIERLRTRLADSEKERKVDGPKVQSRYWTPNEHKRFLEALQKFGPKDVRAIANYVGSRNATQVRTHAQKYFLRVAREAKAGNALQAARKRSMSESDLVRMGRAVGTPPGSPTARRAEVHSPDRFLHAEPDGETSALSSCRDALQDDDEARSPRSQTDVAMAEGERHSVSGLQLDIDTEAAQSHPSAQQTQSAPANASMPPLPPARTLATQVSASKPPMAVPKLPSDHHAGMNLLSLVASERKMETDPDVER